MINFTIHGDCILHGYVFLRKFYFDFPNQLPRHASGDRKSFNFWGGDSCSVKVGIFLLIDMNLLKVLNKLTKNQNLISKNYNLIQLRKL